MDDSCSRPLVARTNDVITVRYENVCAGWEAWTLFSGDRHMDSRDSDWAMQERHFNECVERNAIVLDGGDLCDAMQGRNDKRGGKSGVIDAIHRRTQTVGYWNAVRDYAVEKLSPYWDRIACIQMGNHESKPGELGLTFSSPLVSGGRVFVGSETGGLRCYVGTGK